MNRLKFCINNIPKINFLERKIKISNENIFLYGPPKSGKSYLIFDYLNQKDNFLYIDFSDYKNKNITKDDILLFIQEENIDLVVFDSFDFSFDIDEFKNLIIASNKYKKTNLDEILLMPLDFEEFLLFDKHYNVESAFNSFLKHGNLPYNYNLQDIIKLYSKDETEKEVISLFFKSIGELKSINQLFLTLKKQIKISKDRFYTLAKEYQDNKIIFFIENYENKKALKKLFSYNYAFLDSLTYFKNIKNELSNMVFLELLKYKKEIFYLNNIDFYIPDKNLIVLVIPFCTQIQSIKLISILKDDIKRYNIQNCFIVTISNEFEFNINNLKCFVLPFFRWALL